MFNVGSGEFLVIFLIALVVLGPDKLPEAAKKVGKVMGDLRKMSSGFQQEMKQAMDVEGLRDLKQTLSGTAAPTLPPLSSESSDTTSVSPTAPVPADAPTEIAASSPAEPTSPATGLKSVPNNANPAPAPGQQGAA